MVAFADFAGQRMGVRPLSPQGAYRGSAGAEPWGNLFQDARRLMKLSPSELATRCRTRVEVISALEAGDMARMPPWPETVRIVRAITLPLGIDPQPIIHVMGRSLEAIERRTAAQRTLSQPPRPSPQPAMAAVPWDDPPSWQERLLGFADRLRLPSPPFRRPHNRVMPGVAIPALIMAAGMGAATLGLTVEYLPRPVAKLVYSVRDIFVERFAPIHDGMRWIDVADPRTRRADKLR